MTKLNNKQAAVLGNAANRPEGHLLPLPEGMSLKGGALTTMLRALERRGLTECSSSDTWTITAAGRAAVAGMVGADTDEHKNEQAETHVAPITLEKLNCKGTPTPLFRPGTRQAQLLDLLLRDEGADIDEMMQLTGWQSHSVRATLTGFRKRGIAVTRTKEGNGVSIYRAVLPVAAAAMTT